MVTSLNTVLRIKFPLEDLNAENLNLSVPRIDEYRYDSCNKNQKKKKTNYFSRGFLLTFPRSELHFPRVFVPKTIFFFPSPPSTQFTDFTALMTGLKIQNHQSAESLDKSILIQTVFPPPTAPEDN